MISVHFLFIPILLFLCALFAAAEASIFSLNRGQLESLRDEHPGTYALLRRLLFRPEAILSTCIIGNECLNVAVGTSIAVLVEEKLRDVVSLEVQLVVCVLIGSGLLLVVSEILPKVIAFRLPVLVASTLVYPLSWVHFLLTPFRKVFLWISDEITAFLGIPTAAPVAISEQDFLTLVEVGAETGSLESDEKELIYNVFHFSDLTVSAVMTPWKDVFFIEEGLPVEQVMEQVKRKTFSRIPVFSPKHNRVAGILYTKELLKILLAKDTGASGEVIKQAMFPPYIVSSHKKVAKLFREFQLKKVHIALVVDEYGKHLGIVTLEDLLNSIFRKQRKGETP